MSQVLLRNVTKNSNASRAAKLLLEAASTPLKSSLGAAAEREGFLPLSCFALSQLIHVDRPALETRSAPPPSLLTAVRFSTEAGHSPAVAAELHVSEASRTILDPANIDVAGYIAANYTPYDGDASFLSGPTERTQQVWEHCMSLLSQEHEKGVLDCEYSTPAGIATHGPGYVLNKETDLIVGLQADAPLKRMIKPKGGWRMVEAALKSYGFPVDERLKEIYTKYAKTHNAGVFDAYTKEMKVARHEGILTGLPDAYGRGRIIGDYRRVALYGVDALIAAKEKDKAGLGPEMTEPVIQQREEVSEQIRALKELKQMAESYGYDISRPAKNAREAIQWLYFAYLGSIKEQDGAAMSLGRIDAFVDTYIERDLESGVLSEEQAQELVDDLVIKLRLVRHLRTPDYNVLFAGDPTWVTAVVGGMSAEGERLKSGGRSPGKHMVTKTSYRILHTLRNLGAAPEPNLTVLWSKDLPKAFKDYCAKLSLDLSSIQYENDDIMRPRFGSDNAIACCVSAMAVGKMMQFFGARCNLPKLLLYSLNGGRDELTGVQVGPSFPPLSADGDAPLEYEAVLKQYEEAMEWLSGVYVNTMNVIHYMHDKYNYESLQMALHDTDVHRMMAFGVAGLSVAADSLSAIKHAKVTPIRDERGIAVDFKIEGTYPKYGNDIEEVDDIARWLVNTFMSKLKKHQAYRKAEHTLSVLTITSNIVYGKHTGSTPDGRKVGEPFAPGANPLHGRDVEGALASLNSVAKLPYDACLDGISNTFSIVPTTLGKDDSSRTSNLVRILDGYFSHGAHHLNVNTLNRDTLLDAMEHPENYPQLTIRVSGYAVHFTRLTREQQLEIIARTFHDTM